MCAKLRKVAVKMKFSKMPVLSVIIMIYGITVTFYSGYSGPGIIFNVFFLFSSAVCVPVHAVLESRKKVKAAEFTAIIFTVTNLLYVFTAGEAWIIFKTNLSLSITLFVLENSGILFSDIISVMWYISPIRLGLFLLISAAGTEYLLFTVKKKADRRIIPDTVSYIFFTILASVIIINSITESFVIINGKEKNFHGVNFTNDARKKYSGENHFRKRFNFNLENPDIVIFILESVSAEYMEMDINKIFGNDEHVLNIENFFVSVPHTAASLYSLITGNYGNYRTRQKLSQEDIKNSLPALLKRKGYKSYFLYSGPVYFEDLNCIFGGAGFELYDMEYFKTKKNPVTDLPYSSFSWGVDDAALLNEIPSIIKKGSSPVFLCIGFSSTHSPYFNPAPEIFSRYDNSTAKGRYRNCIDYEMDVMAKIVKLMKSKNDNTLFIVTGDHGESFGERGFMRHSFSLYNTEIKVPFFISHPRLPEVKGPETGSIIDLYPTLLDILGIDQPEKVNGRSLFSPGYSINLFLSSWKTGENKGMIHINRKFLYNKNPRVLYEMDLMDNIIQSVPASAERDSFIRFLEIQY